MLPVASTANSSEGRSNSVQSLTRAFDLLEHMADAGGEIGITDLAKVSGLPLPTIYRLLRTLVNGGYVRQGPSRRYALGPRLIRLGEGAGVALGYQAKPYLIALAEATGETANMAILDGNEVVYVAQAPSKHSMRMFTEVGRRVHVHCTGVGKVMLAQLSQEQTLAIIQRTGLPAFTPATITDSSALLSQLEQIRRQGFSVDEGEQEVGVRCFAVPIAGVPSRSALSVSGPSSRMNDEARATIIPLMMKVATQISSAIVNQSQDSTA
ncbi:MAG: IclR family transcriptional regulator [Acidimicrobiaceae bacterium]|nr:IclR family transcriptional regulator [Acidimicrobiaceae bacterium]